MTPPLLVPMLIGDSQSLASLPAIEGGGPVPSEWPQADLVRRLCLALSIAKRAIGYLAEGGYHDEEVPEANFGPDKPLAETAMLLYAASAVTEHPQLKEWVYELSLLLAPYARSRRTACAIALHPTICFQLAMPHILLSQLGYPDSRFDRLIALSAGSQAQRGKEVVPYRALEEMWLKSLWTEKAPGTEFDAAVLNTVLNHPVDLLWGSRDDAYAHTHAFMYFTNFGYSPRALPRPRQQILGESAAMLARSLLSEDYDLAAEVLMAWPLTAAPWTPAAAFGLRVLADLEDRVGFLPAANGVPEKFDKLTGSERTKYALASAYHTAYVMGVLCALALRERNAPPNQITGPLASAHLIDQLLTAIPDADTPWQRSFRQLRPLEKCALGPFLLDLALLTTCRNRDFSTVGRLLGLAVEHGLANTPLCAQSAELLNRIAACTVNGDKP